jgi:hypothetical protein
MKFCDPLCRFVTLAVVCCTVLAQDSNTESYSSWRVGQPVKTTSGIIYGHAASRRRGVSEYLGIRYARDTSGPRRFAAPVPFTTDLSYDASHFVCNAISPLVNMLTLS